MLILVHSLGWVIPILSSEAELGFGGTVAVGNNAIANTAAAIAIGANAVAATVGGSTARVQWLLEQEAMLIIQVWLLV